MPDRPSHRISLRKQPKQARSAELVTAILDAAVQVLAKEGAQRFTTARVAEKAGVSIGSLYQYFPNKAAILFRLQSEEWRATAEMTASILGDESRPPMERLRAEVHAFLKSECEEAAVRGALADAAPLYRDAPEAREVRQGSEATLDRFMREVLPDAADAERALCGELLLTTLSNVGKSFSETPRTDEEIAAWANAMADMFTAYLEKMAGSDRWDRRRVPHGDVAPHSA